MDFDLEQLVLPFRMQPGLVRLSAGARHFTPLQAGSRLHAEKSTVLERHAPLLAVDGFDLAVACAALQHQAWADGITDAPCESPAAFALAVEQDFALLETATGRLLACCVCLPSHWVPEQKIGLDFAAIHAPVADNAALLAAAPHLLRLLAGGGHWQRHVWTLTPSDRHDQHPLRWPRTPWPEAATPAAFARACMLRVERQTLFPAGNGLTAFTIGLRLQPLTEAVHSRAAARRLHDALASMSDAVLHYKQLAVARTPLLAWLRSRC